MAKQPSRTRGKWRLLARRPTPTFQVLEPVQQFIHTEATGGAVLLASALVALVLANSPLSGQFHDLWEIELGVDLRIVDLRGSMHYWINDGLMTLFFFTVGLEIKRELTIGELSEVRRALVPVAGALGGMLVPAGLFLAITAGGPGASGWGVPMATDIAFSLGLLSLLGDRVPADVRVYLLALAIVDDVGAILAIALFYSTSIDAAGLIGAGVVVILVMLARGAGVRSMAVYWVLGICLWYSFDVSGVHATMAGVLLALLTPVRPEFDHGDFHSQGRNIVDRFEAAHSRGATEKAEQALGQMEELSRRTEAPLERLQRTIHPWSTFLVLPLFALANGGVELSPSHVLQSATQSVFLGTAAGLAVGKVVGIAGATWLATNVFGGALPSGVTIKHVVGVGFLAGIGFTVALFISDLAFTADRLTEQAKLGTLIASLAAGATGFVVLWRSRQAGDHEDV